MSMKAHLSNIIHNILIIHGFRGLLTFDVIDLPQKTTKKEEERNKKKERTS